MRRLTLFLAFTLSLVLTIASVFALRATLKITPDVKENDRAFLNARWGMDSRQVEKANRMSLEPVVDNKRFYYDAQADPSRYRSYEQPGVKFLGRQAKVTYTFHDGRLFTYHVFVSDMDGEKLNADLRRYLARTFGDRSSSQEEGSMLKLVWQFKDKTINYWFMEEELSLRPKYTAGFGVSVKEN